MDLLRARQLANELGERELQATLAAEAAEHGHLDPGHRQRHASR